MNYTPSANAKILRWANALPEYSFDAEGRLLLPLKKPII